MSVQAVHAALRELLMQLGLPVYLSGQVPPGTGHPLMTFSLSGSAMWQPMPIAVTVWTPEGHAACLSLLDRLLQLIPPEGRLLRLEEGWLMLHRQGWQEARDEEEPSLTGVTLRVEGRMSGR